jgi:hypothetical protein
MSSRRDQQRKAGLAVAVSGALLVLLASTAGQAGGSLPMNEVVNRLAGQSPALMIEIAQRVKANALQLSDIVCTGTRLGRHFTHLGGLRIPTFRCDIGQSVLILEGDTNFYDAAGAPEAGPDTAVYAVSSSPSWNWE